jgi:hypothetical protein
MNTVVAIAILALMAFCAWNIIVRVIKLSKGDYGDVDLKDIQMPPKHPNCRCIHPTAVITSGAGQTVHLTMDQVERIKQYGTTTGRFQCSEPNESNVPKENLTYTLLETGRLPSSRERRLAHLATHYGCGTTRLRKLLQSKGIAASVIEKELNQLLWKPRKRDAKGRYCK